MYLLDPACIDLHRVNTCTVIVNIALYSFLLVVCLVVKINDSDQSY